MNDCESRHESISLLAANCLDPAEETELRAHFTECAPCRTRFEQLEEVSNGLIFVKPKFHVPSFRFQVSGSKNESVQSHSVTLSPCHPVTSSPFLRISKSRRLQVFLAAAAVAMVLGFVWFHRANNPSLADSNNHPIYSGNPPMAVPAVSFSPATLMDYERALAKSDDALDELLSRQSEALAFDDSPRLSMAALLNE